jgi:hypothetical protein
MIKVSSTPPIFCSDFMLTSARYQERETCINSIMIIIGIIITIINIYSPSSYYYIKKKKMLVSGHILPFDCRPYDGTTHARYLAICCEPCRHSWSNVNPVYSTLYPARLLPCFPGVSPEGCSTNGNILVSFVEAIQVII